MKTDSGQLFKLRAYFEGVQFPIGRVQISCGVNAPAVAFVSIPPIQSALGLKPKTRIQITWIDYTYDEKRAERVIFEGEYTEYQDLNRPSSRTFNIIASDISHYLDQIFIPIVSVGEPSLELYSYIISGVGSDGLYFPKKAKHMDSLSDAFEKAVLQVPEDSKNPLGDVIGQMIWWIKDHPYFAARDLLYDFEKRFKFREVNEETINKVLFSNIKNLNNSINERMQMIYGKFITYRNFFDTLASNLRYHFVPIPAARKNGDNLCQMLFKNEGYYWPPPKCNIIFSSRSSESNTARRFLTEPTRGFGITHSNSRPIGSHIFPKELQQRYDKAHADEGSTYNERLKIIGEPLDSEIYTGPIMTSPIYIGGKFDYALDKDKEPSTDIGAAKLDFEFSKQRREHRRGNYSTDFNPYIQPGFPGAYIDKNGMATLGYIVAVTHIGDPEGMSSTNVSMTYCRQYSLGYPFESPLDEWMYSEPNIPVWETDDLNTDINKINEFYMEFLGCPSILDGELPQSSDENDNSGDDKTETEAPGTKSDKIPPPPDKKEKKYKNPFVSDLREKMISIYEEYSKKITDLGEGAKFGGEYRFREIATKEEADSVGMINPLLNPLEDDAPLDDFLSEQEAADYRMYSIEQYLKELKLEGQKATRGLLG